MMDSLFFLLLLSTFRLALPLLFATCGGYFSEKSGVAQLALEAYLLIGAFVGAATAIAFNSMPIAFLSAGLVAILFAQIFCFLVLKLKSNSIVIGTALNLLVMGLIPIVSKTLFNSTGSTPAISIESDQTPFILITLIFTVILSYYASEKTIWGLQMKFAGEKKLALESSGVSPLFRQWQAVSLCAFITALGGAVLSTYLSSSYSPMMSAGRGFIALASIIFSGWRLRRALVISLLFGFCEALQIQLQSNVLISSKIPAEFIQMIPYLATLVALFFYKNRNQPPAEIK